ncbi:MAG: hypothetical protein DIU78_018180 [Pseudomonadota bacterium]
MIAGNPPDWRQIVAMIADDPPNGDTIAAKRGRMIRPFAAKLSH